VLPTGSAALRWAGLGALLRLAGLGGVAETGLAQAQQVKMQQIDAAARAEETQSLINRYNAPGSTGGYGFGAFSGAQRGGF
jgi:hypothetical protein